MKYILFQNAMQACRIMIWAECYVVKNASVIDVQTRAGCDVSLDGSVYRLQTSFLCTTNNKKKISDSDSKRFWLRGSGQSGPKLHCRNVVNILNAVDLLHPLWKTGYYLQGALVSLRNSVLPNEGVKDVSHAVIQFGRHPEINIHVPKLSIREHRLMCQ